MADNGELFLKKMSELSFDEQMEAFDQLMQAGKTSVLLSAIVGTPIRAPSRAHKRNPDEALERYNRMARARGMPEKSFL